MAESVVYQWSVRFRLELLEELRACRWKRLWRMKQTTCPGEQVLTVQWCDGKVSGGSTYNPRGATHLHDFKNSAADRTTQSCHRKVCKV